MSPRRGDRRKKKHDESPPTEVDVEAAALGYLTRRDHAEGELREKLHRKGFDDELIDPVLERFRQYGYLDDARFARQQAAILARKHWGPLQIANKLRDRGVDPTITDAVLAELEEEVSWEESCRERLVAKFGPPSELDDKGRQRAYRHLMYRGFPSNIVRRVIFEG